jgi:F-type H+-transporting ATPase subunit beta
MATNGTITQVIGSTFDAQFPEDGLPEIYNAIEIKAQTKVGSLQLVGEVQSHLGGGRVRAVALGSTDGLTRGMTCVDTGAPVSVPVGEGVLGRVFNLLGEPIDKAGPVNATKRSPIHKAPPEFAALNPNTEILVTGIKVIDLRPRWQDRSLRWCRRGQDRRDPGDDRASRQELRWLLRVCWRGRAHT